MRKLTEAQMLLATHLHELIPQDVQFEWPVCSTRRWRYDVAVPALKLAFECNGHWNGKHGAGWSEGSEKMNVAQALGWKVFVFHNREVLNGNAKAWIKKHLLAGKKSLASKSGQE